MRRLLLLVVVVLAGCGEKEEPADRWVTYRDTARAFSISYPAFWQRAREPLTPGLSNPHEIFTVGTARRLRAGGERCNHVPENAMRDLRRGDVLLTLQERRGSGGFGDRERPYRIGPTPHAPSNECAERTDIRLGQGGFRDAGRGVHVYAVLGPGTDVADRRTLERVVDSLKFEPAWRSREWRVRLQPPSGWKVSIGRRGLELTGPHALVDLREITGLTRAQRLRVGAYPRFEITGDDMRFRWRDRGRVFDAHATLAPGAPPVRRDEMHAALSSIVTY